MIMLWFPYVFTTVYLSALVMFVALAVHANRKKK